VFKASSPGKWTEWPTIWAKKAIHELKTVPDEASNGDDDISAIANRTKKAHDRSMDTIFPYAFGGLTLAVLGSLIVGYLFW
jgi:hypothetical protein